MKIVIIGHGVVGKAIAKNYCSYASVCVIDREYHGAISRFGEFESRKLTPDYYAKDSEIGFVCVPYNDSSDTQSLVSAVERALQLCQYVVVKSTLDMDVLQSLHTLKGRERVILMPEFLTENNAVSDYRKQTHFIIGVDSSLDKRNACEFLALFSCLHEITDSNSTRVTYKIVDKPSAVFIKLFRNTFLASKVALFNQFQEIMRAELEIVKGQGVDISEMWEVVRSGITEDLRIGDSHTYVPGPDGKFGYGGKCFPKDVSLLENLAKSNGSDHSLLSAVKSFNDSIRDL